MTPEEKKDLAHSLDWCREFNEKFKFSIPWELWEAKLQPKNYELSNAIERECPQ
jgi:hypothetical protein